MKSKHLFFSLLTFAMLVMSSCSEKDTDYAERFIGEYNITLTPNLVATIDMGQIPITFEKITTTCNIVKEDDKGNVKIVIEPINGVIGRIELEAFCDGLGMHIEDYSYNGSIAINEIDKINCNIKLKNREVMALVYEYKNDNRDSINFVYNDLLVEVRCDTQVWNEQWFAGLSFDGTDKD